MGFNVQWDNDEHTIIVSRVQGDWTWPEFIAQIREAYNLIETVDHTVNVIVRDLSGGQVPPGDMMIQLRNVRSERPPNMGMLILIGANPFIRAIGHIMSRVYPRQASMLQYVQNVDAAYQLIGVSRSSQW